MKRSIGVAVFASSAAWVCAQESARPPAPPPAESPLGGPSVQQPSRPATLVERDYEGRVRRLDTPPEEEAVKLLALSADEQAAADKVLAERARLLDDFVSEHFDLLARSAGAFAGNRRADKLRAVAEVFSATRPLRARGALIDELADAMGPENAARLRALVADYWDALIRDEQERGRARTGGREPRIAVLLREKAELLGREIQRSFQRQLPPGGEREFDALLASMELRPDQERRVRRRAEEFIIRAKFRPTPEQERRFILEVTAILDERQRRLLAEHVARERRAEMMQPPG